MWRNNKRQASDTKNIGCHLSTFIIIFNITPNGC